MLETRHVVYRFVGGIVFICTVVGFGPRDKDAAVLIFALLVAKVECCCEDYVEKE
ncbi:unnamed protein product [Rodentolepis nana]|uniref:Uncharacterized protein n=1 Tax=Rodentolepis nana TaxID=102285 RepID=A0A3P7RZE5_RODNA|nr:unnamed protein product [Rodentolepis nana]